MCADKQISLSFNDITVNGVAEMLEALRTNKQIKKVNAFNQIILHECGDDTQIAKRMHWEEYGKVVI